MYKNWYFDPSLCTTKRLCLSLSVNVKVCPFINLITGLVLIWFGTRKKFKCLQLARIITWICFGQFTWMMFSGKEQPCYCGKRHKFYRLQFRDEERELELWRLCLTHPADTLWSSSVPLLSKKVLDWLDSSKFRVWCKTLLLNLISIFKEKFVFSDRNR